jgi:selenocysteine lyase/cysteine desulfurase
MKVIEEHEAALAETFRTAFGDIPGVELYTAPDGVRKTPTIAFTVQGQAPEEICLRMLEHGFFIAAGDFYASTLAEKLSIGDSGGFIRAGLAPYNTEDEVERFVQALVEIVRET